MNLYIARQHSKRWYWASVIQCKTFMSICLNAWMSHWLPWQRFVFSECCSSWCVDCSGYRRSLRARTEAVRDTRDTWWRPVAGVLSNADRHRPTTSGSFAWLSRFVSCLQYKFYFSFIFGPAKFVLLFSVCASTLCSFVRFIIVVNRDHHSS